MGQHKDMKKSNGHNDNQALSFKNWTPKVPWTIQVVLIVFEENNSKLIVIIIVRVMKFGEY